MIRWLAAGALALAAGASVVVLFWDREAPLIDASHPGQVAQGRQVYEQHCAACHGMRLEGQPNWQSRLPNGRVPAPPHDATGHTWHHPDAILFGIVKEGLVPGKYAPPGYQSDMPAYAGVLSDEAIRASLAYIKSTWPARAAAAQREIDRRSRGDAGR